MESLRDIIKRSTSDEIRDEIMYFSIFWNLFEKNFYMCSKGPYYKFNSDNTNELVNRINKEKNEEKINTLTSDLKSYNNKYKNINEIYKVYHIKDKDILLKDFEILYTDNSMDNNIRLLILLTGRVRNNMFHGIKIISELNEQIKLFKLINSFLEFTLEELNVSI